MAPGPGVRWAGAQRAVLGGDLRGYVELETLSSVPYLYALGPLEELRGQVSIFARVPSIARIDAVATVASWSGRACFLVGAQVPAWSERVPGDTPAGLDGIEREVVALAREAGLDQARPLPFRVRGTAVEVTLDVLDKRDGLPHNPERRELAKVRRTLQHAAVELIGFYSRQHRGIFTPRESNVPVHLRTEDGRISGHLVALLHQGRLARLGPPDDMITRESLREVYGVELTVTGVSRADGSTARVCIPTLSPLGRGWGEGRGGEGRGGEGGRGILRRHPGHPS